ncbi:MAG: Gfo/Idh/MocA family oxidoreductase, partial [Planctomycetota bacterium]
MTSKHSSKTSRRSFIKKAALASSTIVVPTIIPRHVLGSPESPGANDQINVGIIGMGVRGAQLITNVPQSGRIGAICDTDQRKTSAAINEHRADWKVYQDYRNLIEQKDLDAVIVATTDHHHVLAGMLACQAGLDVYCEKPVSLYLKEGRALVNAARKYKRVI